MRKVKVIIMGAAGRDFHNFNVYFRNNSSYKVVGFTAYQIPNIEDRKYPAKLAGKFYPKGVPIHPEEELGELIKKYKVDEVVFSYSDVSHEYLMHRAAIANAAGANFVLLGARQTMLKSKKPIIAVCAVRTGSGKSQVSRKVVRYLRDKKIKVAAIRHPMPYSDLVKQEVQRFAEYSDLDKHNCTIEEREEYEPYIEQSLVVFAGVDYKKILNKAEKEADVIIWDGGNNDTPFYIPDLHIVVVDPHRPGHELKFYPGETNFRMADVILVNKLDSAKSDGVKTVFENIKRVNPKAALIKSESKISISDPKLIKGRKVLVIEDGPTVTHGDMAYGAGYLAAKKFKAKSIIDPRPFAVGTIKKTLDKFPHLENVLPAMGYGNKQMKDLEKTIDKSDCEVVIVGTPIDLAKLLEVKKETVRVNYDIEEIGKPTLDDVLRKFLRKI
jgi:predicted GTPase